MPIHSINGEPIEDEFSSSTLESRTLSASRQVSGFDVTGGTFTGFVPESSSTPYTIGAFNSSHCELTVTRESGQTDLWIGFYCKSGSSDSGMQFIGSNLFTGDGGRVRRVANGASSTTVLFTMSDKVAVTVGTHDISVDIGLDYYVTIRSDGNVVQHYQLPESYRGNLRGIAFLNFGIGEGMIGSVSVCESLEQALGNRDVYWRRVFKSDVNDRLANIKQNGAIEVPASSAWEDAPVTADGALLNIRFNENYNLQLFFGYGNSQTFYRVVNRNTGADYLQWRYIGQNGTTNPLVRSMFTTKKVVFAGDSIVAGLKGSGYDISGSHGEPYIMSFHDIERYENRLGHCWVNSLIEHMATVYGKTDVHNRGVGGIKTGQVYSNWDTIVGDADVVVLSVGTNDYQNISNVNAGLLNISRLCRERGTDLMVMSNTPNNTSDAAKYNSVKGRIAAFCQNHNVPFYDMYSEFELLREAKGLTLSEVMDSDGIHPNDVGYDLMYSVALKLFQL